MLKNDRERKAGGAAGPEQAVRSVEKRLEEKLRASLRDYVLDFTGRGAEVIVRSLPAPEIPARVAREVAAALRPLVSEEAGSPPRKAPIKRKCPACGQPIGSEARFCGSCGAPIEAGNKSDSPACPSCGSKVSPRAKFCRSCGGPLH